MISSHMKQSGKIDIVLFVSVLMILVFGLIMLSSASAPVGLQRFQDQYFFIKRQLLFGFLPGMIFFLFLSKFSYTTLIKYALPIFLGSLILLLAVFIPGIGSSLNTGSHSWLVIGSYSFQPAEFAKLAMIIFFASWLSKKASTMKDWKHGFLPAVFLGMIPIGLVILQPDVGTVSILFAIFFGLLFFANTKMTHMTFLAGLALAGLAVMIIAAPYRTERLMTFLRPELDPKGIGYQINQAFVAVGSGGLFGLGYNNSRQKFQYLPEVHADSIFAIIAEEMGFVISILYLVLLVYVAHRGLTLAKSVPDANAGFLVGGIIVWILAQSFLNIGSIVGVLPLTGVPLPFVSHGGSALLAVLTGAGMVVNISKQ